MASSLCALKTQSTQATDDFAAAFASWYVQLLRQLQHESPPQITCHLVITLAACVDLHLKLPSSLVPELIPYIDGSSKAPAKAAACATSAWAAAAPGIVDTQGLELILHVQGKHQQPWSNLPWFWLSPISGDSSKLLTGCNQNLLLILTMRDGDHDRVAAFGTRPVPGVPAPPQLLSALHAVLDEYSVADSSNVHLGCLVAAVVVKAQGKQEGAWVFDFMTPADF